MTCLIKSKERSYFLRSICARDIISLELKKADVLKTTFKTSYGHDESLLMPFRFTNALETFMELMNRDFIYYFLVYFWSEGEHVEHLRTILQTLKQK